MGNGQLLEIQTTEHSEVVRGCKERTSQNLAFVDGLQDHNAAFVKQSRKLHEKPVLWVFVNITEGRKQPKGRETRILTAAKGDIFQ